MFLKRVSVRGEMAALVLHAPTPSDNVTLPVFFVAFCACVRLYRCGNTATQAMTAIVCGFARRLFEGILVCQCGGKIG
eukprot:8112091-Lingulodinium_polyedra.AAC.1